MVEITNSLNYQQCTPSPVGEGWGEQENQRFSDDSMYEADNKSGV